MNIPDEFDLDTALEFGRLCLQAYQMLDDFNDGKNFQLPPPFNLEMVFCITDRFVGETIDTSAILDKQFCTGKDEVPTLPPRFLEYIHVKTDTAITFGKPIRNPFDFERIEDNHIMLNYYNALTHYDTYGFIEPHKYTIQWIRKVRGQS